MAETSGLSSLPRRGRLRGGDPTKIKRDRAKALADVAANKDMSTLDKAALVTATLPVIGDIIGGVSDAKHLYKDPSLANLGFLLAGLVPFVPSGGVSRAALKSTGQKGLSNLINYVPGFYKKDLGRAGQGAAFAKTIPEGIFNAVRARYNPSDRGLQQNLGISVTDRKVAKAALRISAENTSKLRPLEKQIRAMKKEGIAYIPGEFNIKVVNGKETKTPKKTKAFKKITDDAKKLRSEANDAGKKAMGQLNQTRSMVKQYDGPEGGLSGLLGKADKIDHVANFKTLNVDNYFKTVGDLIPTSVGKKGVDEIFKQIKTLPAIGYDAKKNYQMNIRRVQTGSSGVLDQGPSARLYATVDTSEASTMPIRGTSITDSLLPKKLSTDLKTKKKKKSGKAQDDNSIGVDGKASLLDIRESIFMVPLGGASAPGTMQFKSFGSTKAFLKKLDETGLKILNRDEMLKGIKEGKDVPAVITGSAKTDAYEIGGANYMSAISKKGEVTTIVNDEHDLLGKYGKLPGADRYMNVSEPIVIDLFGIKEPTIKQLKAQSKSKTKLDKNKKEALEEYNKIPGVDTSGKLPVGFKTKEQWGRAQAVALKEAPKDYSRLGREVVASAPLRVGKEKKRQEEELAKKKSEGSVVMRNPYDYNPRGI